MRKNYFISRFMLLLVLIFSGCLTAPPFATAPRIVNLAEEQQVAVLRSLGVNAQLELWRFAYYGFHPPHVAMAYSIRDAGVVKPEDVIEALGAAKRGADVEMLARLLHELAPEHTACRDVAHRTSLINACSLLKSPQDLHWVQLLKDFINQCP